MVRRMLLEALSPLLVAAAMGSSFPSRHASAEQPGSTQAVESSADPADGLELRQFRSAQGAFRYLLRDKPAVLGVGEYHQTEGDVKVPSAIRRFTRGLLPLLRRRVSDLVVETWVTEGNCGSEEKQVVEDVEKTTERPAQTEDEILTLIKRARRYRIRPHILSLSCASYRQLLASDGVDYHRLLELTGRRLREKVLGIVKVRLDPIKRAVDDSLRAAWGSGGAGKRDIVVVYGGAIHNDLQPSNETASFSYAPAVAKATGGRYIEVDLVVPEFLSAANSLVSRQPWFPLFEHHKSRRHVLLIRRSTGSYVLVFRQSVSSTPKG